LRQVIEVFVPGMQREIVLQDPRSVAAQTARLTATPGEQYIHCIYMAASTQIAKWGNSLGLRLPKSVALEAQLDEGDTVHVSVKNGAIVVKPARPTYSLDALVRKITRRNRHDETDWGPSPAGRELW
jgi:antitoxin MazE